MIATEIRKLAGWRGDARLYRLKPPFEGNRYVIVSKAFGFVGWETYVFPAKENGEPVTMGEIGASQKGNIGHYRVLEEMGYQIESSAVSAPKDKCSANPEGLRLDPKALPVEPSASKSARSSKHARSTKRKKK